MGVVLNVLQMLFAVVLARVQQPLSHLRFRGILLVRFAVPREVCAHAQLLGGLVMGFLGWTHMLAVDLLNQGVLLPLHMGGSFEEECGVSHRLDKHRLSD